MARFFLMQSESSLPRNGHKGRFRSRSRFDPFRTVVVTIEGVIVKIVTTNSLLNNRSLDKSNYSEPLFDVSDVNYLLHVRTSDASN